jgi:predicted nucleic acid-binding protein
MKFIDANIFIRHLTRDDPQKAQACLELLQQAQEKATTLITSESVIAEVVYVLSSKRLYNLPRAEIRKLLYPLLSLPGLKLANRKTYLHALDLYALYTLGFEDALTLAQMKRQNITEIYSYDHHFDQVEGITRLEP